MGRSRSPSPAGARHRDRGDRDRERDRDRDRRRRRSRDRTDTSSRRRRSGDRERPRRSFSRSPPPKEKEREPKPGPVAERPVLTEEELKDKSPAEQEMMKLMGFCAFDTTKGKKVTGNEAGTVHVILKRKYRQYMNRKGGFNRPLDFVA